MSQGRLGRGSARRDKKRAVAMALIVDLPAGIPATPAERGYDVCPCPKDCSLRGSCHLCAAYHGRKGHLPRCER